MFQHIYVTIPVFVLCFFFFMHHVPFLVLPVLFPGLCLSVLFPPGFLLCAPPPLYHTCPPPYSLSAPVPRWFISVCVLSLCVSIHSSSGHCMSSECSCLRCFWSRSWFRPSSKFPTLPPSCVLACVGFWVLHFAFFDLNFFSLYFDELFYFATLCFCCFASLFFGLLTLFCVLLGFVYIQLWE